MFKIVLRCLQLLFNPLISITLLSLSYSSFEVSTGVDKQKQKYTEGADLCR